MTEAELCSHVAGVEKALPEHAISARLALSLVFSEIARMRQELDGRKSAPVLRLVTGGGKRHASVELIEAIGGIGSSTGSAELRTACGSKWEIDRLVFAFVSPRPAQLNSDDSRTVTCPNCLVLMDEARGKDRREELAVRADWLIGRTS